MIQFVEMECPNCAGKLQKSGEKTAKCNHCGMEFLIDEGQPEHVTNIYQTTQTPYVRQQNHTGITVALVFFLAGIVMLVVLWFADKPIQKQESVPAIAVNEEEEQEIPEGFISEFFGQLAENIYGISRDEVTPEQLAKLTYLHIFWENDCTKVEYTLEDGEMKQLEMASGLKTTYFDLRNFTGLKGLRIESGELLTGYLDGLNDLTQVWMRNSPEELASIIPNPGQITSLGCYSASSLDGINAFENLEQLYIKDFELTDIGALGAVKNLKDLQIDSGDGITDFGVLNSLTGLERLYIDAEGLKDVSFIKNMPQLKELKLYNTIVIDLSPLEGLSDLTSLYLEKNGEIKDYSVLEGLTGLETLELDLGSWATMPSVENWQNLRNLSVRGADSISFLSALPQLISLSISGSDCTDCNVLSTLTNLESLKLKGIYGEIEDLRVLNQMPGLKTLDLQSLSLYGNVEYIFGIPALEELNINDCSFGLDFDVMPENANLKRLYMNRLKVEENISVEYDGMMAYVDYKVVSLSDQMDFLAKFPNLEELYAQGNKLTGVEFTENLPMLKKLDITDNYVTDIRPLEKLINLETVWCGENSISQGNSLSDHVTVIFDSESDFSWW